MILKWLKILLYAGSLLCGLPCILCSQVTYELHGKGDGEQTIYTIYQTDLWSGSFTPICQIEERELNTNMDIFFHMAAFELNPTRDTAYLLTRQGGLYECDCATGQGRFLADISFIDTSPFIYSHTYDLFFYNDSTLLIGGEMFAFYHLNSGDITVLRHFDSFDDAFENSDRASYKMFRHQGQYVYYSPTNLEDRWKLYLFDPQNPDEHQLFHDLGPFVNQWTDGIIEVRNACDSSQLWMRFRDSNSTFWWYQIDLSTGDTTPVIPASFSPDTTLARDIKHYNQPPWERCANYIDLDEDDSTAPGEDFFYADGCESVDIPLTNDDLLLRNREPMDSIEIRILNPRDEDIIDLVPGNYRLRQYSDNHLVIISQNSTTLTDLREALLSARYSYYDSDPRGTVRIEITPWHHDQRGLIATATLNLPDHLPDAGPDRLLSHCLQENSILLTEFIDSDSMDSNGRFLDSDFQILTDVEWSLQTPGRDTFYYVSEIGQCADSSRWILEILDGTSVSLPDLYLCHDQSTIIDLSDSPGSIRWENDSTSPMRRIDTPGSYQVTIGIGTECESTDSFTVSIADPAERIHNDASVCLGDQYNFLGQLLSHAGSYTDTIHNAQGCDSVIYSLNLSVISPHDIEFTGDLAFCEGESSSITILTPGQDWTLNSESINPTFHIHQEGEYLLEGMTADGCPLSSLLVFTELPAPQITIGAFADTVYSHDLRLLPTFSPNATEFIWSPSTHLSCSDCPSPSVLNPGITEYQVSAISEDGCRSHAVIQIHYDKKEYYLANVIHPESPRQENQRLFLMSENDQLYNLQVYNRWGSLIYEGINLVSNAPQQGWLPGPDILPGVYVYHVQIQDLEATQLAGNITVIR